MTPQNTSTNLTGDSNTANPAQNLESIKMEKLEGNQSQSHLENLDDTVIVVVPPDGGWAWVVMMASFFCNTVVDGIVFNSGAIQKHIIADFNVSGGYVALVSSLLSGFYLMAGPFVSALANRFGFRPVTISGAFVASFAFGISYFANSVEYLFITYGIIGGIGFCLIYIPSVISIGYYFEKWRALATGIALCGSGVGTFLFAPLTDYLIKELGWRGALLVQAGIILSCVIYGAAYRPISPVQIPITEEVKDEQNIKEFNKFSTKVCNPLPEGRFAYSVPNSSHSTYMGMSSSYLYPTAAEIFRRSAANLERRLSSTSSGNTNQNKSGGVQRKSQPNGELAIQNNSNIHKELTTVGENEEEEADNLLAQETKPSIVTARRHTVSGRRFVDSTTGRSINNLRGNPVNDIRPMYRDDVFFTGSLVRIPQYTSQSSLGYHMSVTRLPTKQDLIEQREKSCKLCPEAIRRTLSTMMDISLLSSPSFMLLATSGFLTMMGFFVPFIFVTRRAENAGMSEGMSLFIISAIGITNTIARIGCGFLTSFKSISALHLNNVAITAGGIATICSGFIINETTQFLFAAIFGICIACFSALRSIIAVELMGLEKLTNAFGFLMLFQGLAAALGAPIAGLFYDLTGSYDSSFWFAGALITISAILCYPLNYVNKWESSRAKNIAENNI